MTKKKKRPVRRRKRAVATARALTPPAPQFVTRDMLAQLRDEIENMLGQCEHQLANTGRRYNELRNAYERAIGFIENIRLATGVNLNARPPDAVAQQLVPLALFEIMIKKIEQRLTALERRTR